MDNKELIERAVKIAEIQKKIERLEAWQRFIQTGWFDLIGLLFCTLIVYLLVSLCEWAWSIYAN